MHSVYCISCNALKNILTAVFYVNGIRTCFQTQKNQPKVNQKHALEIKSAYLLNEIQHTPLLETKYEIDQKLGSYQLSCN